MFGGEIDNNQLHSYSIKKVEMKNFLKKLHIGASSEIDSDSSNSSSPTKGSCNNASPQHKPFSAISGWLNSVRHSNSNINSPPSSDSLDAALEAVNRDSGHDVEVEEEYQIQMALELSAREDPEAVQIEAVKQISLGSCPPHNTPGEIVAYRYWNYNALNYDDKIPDGFYDLYGVLTESSSSKMPSLVDLQATSIAGNINWEAVLVNRAADTKLLNLEQKALQMAVNVRSRSVKSVDHLIVQKLASLVSEHMGGPVGNPERMLMAWRDLSHSLKSNHGSVVLPLGSLTVGLARHRALLFKVLADSLGIRCRLVKGRQFTGSDDVAMNFVKIDDEREYIVDLMSDPGTLIPSDATAASDEGSSNRASSSGVVTVEKRSKFSVNIPTQKESTDTKPPLPSKQKATGLDMYLEVKKETTRPNHARSPSWTEGVSPPAARRMKVKDVSQYMIDAAKDNPQLAQKLHNVLLESGVVAPPDLFTEMYPDQIDMRVTDKRPQKQETKNKVSDRSLLPPLHSRGNQAQIQPKENSASSESETEFSNNSKKQNLPVTAAAAAAAAVVASSMVVAPAKSSTDPKLHLPVAAAATATAAAVVATTTAVNKKCENLDNLPDSPAILNQLQFVRNGEAEIEQRGCCDQEQEAQGIASEGDRASDMSTGNESSKSDTVLDDVADCEIPWEDISLGERIGLGSYGEVYRGDWHGTEVAVKKFLDQNIACESLEEFKSEVLIMRKVRHPNVVLFMGAITRPPNLSIVTEFLPRGSLYRLIHRPNNQLDERKRLRMALDTARGMNYLHNCTPMIVHRDLKSPNLLVDKNWVVKVCDFGLSRMKHSTFLSSRSAAGTAEWMAPEVLRNEPSNEKCDVYSFGVILWELCTLQQPWGGLNPMQVVGAVGFQHRRLDIPDNMDPVVADLIRKCWETDPKLRPSFADIMAALKPLQKPITSSQTRTVSRGKEKVQRSVVNPEDPGDQS